MKKTKLIALCLVVVMLASMFVGCAPKAVETPAETPATTEAAVETPAAAPLKAALLMSGVINDGGWNQSAYEGLVKLQDELGYEIAFTEKVQQADQANIMRDYAKKGFNLIVGHGFEYGDALTAVAAEYPDVKFAQVGGGAGGTQPNITSGFTIGSDIGYLAGILAGKITKVNKIGFVGAMEIPTIVEAVDYFEAALKTTNPTATVTRAYTGSWDDINKGKEAALAQIAAGCDVLMGIGDACDAGAIQACQEKGVKFIGFAGEFNKLAPETVVTSYNQDIRILMMIFGNMVKDNKFVAEAASYGIVEGVNLSATWAPNVDAKIKSDMLALEAKIKSGELTLDQIKTEINYKPRA
ncbi:MAG: BMP family protein [Clostridia bacterium]